MEKLFQNEQWPDRPINIYINKDDDHISFRFAREGNREFYWIGVSDWIVAEQNWERHMQHKAWFTKNMNDYINEQVARPTAKIPA